MNFSREGAPSKQTVRDAFFDFVERFCTRYDLEEQCPDLPNAKPMAQLSKREKSLLEQFENNRATLERLGFDQDSYLKFAQPCSISLANSR